MNDPGRILVTGLARRSHRRLRAGALTALLFGLSTMVASCLVTSSPTFDDPVRTAPFLVPDSFLPDPRKLVVLSPTSPTLPFTGFYVGEDAGESVEAKLLLDYGWPDDTLPYRDAAEGVVLDPPGTMDGDARRVRADWKSNQLDMTPGCHRLTLMVSHAFDASTGCPVDADDYSLVTWTILMCDDLGICPAIDEGNDPSCPPVTASCANATLTTSSGGQ